MSKAERNDQIIEGLKQEGTLSGAARHASVDRGTVRRLIGSHEEASDALLHGQERRLMRRVVFHAQKVRGAFNQLKTARAELRVEQAKLVDHYAGMSAEQVKEADSALCLLYDKSRAQLQRLRRCDQAHEQAIRCYAAHVVGMSVGD